MSVISYIYPSDLFKAAALNAYLRRGYEMDVAVELANEAAAKMRDEEESCDYSCA